VPQPHVVHRTPASELWLAEFSDPDGNHLALMSEVPVAKASAQPFAAADLLRVASPASTGG